MVCGDQLTMNPHVIYKVTSGSAREPMYKKIDLLVGYSKRSNNMKPYIAVKAGIAAPI